MSLVEHGLDELIVGKLKLAAGDLDLDDWRDLLDSYARCLRITRDQKAIFGIDEARFVEPSAIALYEAYRRARIRVGQNRTVDELLGAIEALRPAITRFFEDVLVMAEDRALRENRLCLLQAIAALAGGIVDLTALEGF